MNDREKRAAEDTPRDEMKRKLAEMEIREYEETEAIWHLAVSRPSGNESIAACGVSFNPSRRRKSWQVCPKCNRLLPEVI